MSALTRSFVSPRSLGGVVRTQTASPTFQHGRTATHRRIASLRSLSSNYDSPPPSYSILQSQSPFLRLHPHPLPLTSRRPISYRDIKKGKDPEKDAKTTPKPQQTSRPQSQPEAKRPAAASASSQEETEPPKTNDAAADEAEQAYRKARAESEKQEAKFRQQREKARQRQQETGEEEKEPEAPQHGNKSPWQVFTETLSSEFKASKDWNEGTKQLAGSMHDFTQNPNVQKARSAYTKATDVAGSATSSALKSTASAIGQSAAWTWDTGVVRGVRKGVGAVGSGLEQATRPLRETEAFKNVKDTIDDGSSSRYGGWTEKEERKRRREAKELREASQGKSRRAEPMVEDPE